MVAINRYIHIRYFFLFLFFFFLLVIVVLVIVHLNSKDNSVFGVVVFSGVGGGLFGCFFLLLSFVIIMS